VAQLKPDFIKIDMALTRAIERWQIKQRLVASVAHFAKEEGIEIVAEGIETKEECEMVEALGCDLQQGFLHGRPSDPSW
ncbi:MAG: EAL domain-containing protein, partial [Myxococcota bacterium]